ncbi:hypothetical protein JHK82_014018 [Glycine max]|nr:hypothetical protein JHK82_014018 [Glycine max]
MDREIGRSRGFGFVTYISVGEASSAIQVLDGYVSIMQHMVRQFLMVTAIFCTLQHFLYCTSIFA